MRYFIIETLFQIIETTASGDGDILLSILQELLLIPIGARNNWEAILKGIQVIIYRYK